MYVCVYVCVYVCMYVWMCDPNPDTVEECKPSDWYVASLGHMHGASQHESVTQAGLLRIEGLPLGP